MAFSQSDFPFQTAEEEGRVTVRFPANTTLSETNADAFSRGLLSLVESKDRPHLLVDLGGVVMLTSVILSKLIAINNKVRAAGGRLTLFNPSRTVEEVFKVTHLDSVIELRARPDSVPV